jgi:type III pantothenate kinase
MSALLLDVGNTRLKWGVLEDGAIRRTGHIGKDTLRDQGLGALTSRLPRRVDTIMVSNVAGTSFATRLTGVLGMHCGCDVHFARTQKAACGVTNSYRQPRQMGVDRWVAMIGAWGEFSRSCLVVDAGTAVTIDALDDDGRHLGGQILPGVSLMARALAVNTSDIPESRRRSPRFSRGLDMFASSTDAAVAQGALNAVVGAAERARHTLQLEGLEPRLILTGGDASRILGSLDEESAHRPHLVLQGLATLLEHHR